MKLSLIGRSLDQSGGRNREQGEVVSKVILTDFRSETERNGSEERENMNEKKKRWKRDLERK